MTSVTLPSVVVLGTGRVGSALARALGPALVGVTGRSPADVRRLADECSVPALDPTGLPDADLVVLAVSDDQIPSVAGGLASTTRPGAVVHCSGATGRDALGACAERGWTTGAWHPFQAFATRASEVRAGTMWTITADEPLAETLGTLTEAVGGIPYRLADEHRRAYHAAASLAVIAAVTALAEADAVLGDCGLDDAPTTAALVDLVTGSLSGVRTVGPAQGLTGPLVRGDVGTVRAHLDALAGHPRAARLYSASAAAAVPLLRERGLPDVVVDAVGRTLGDS